VGIEEYSGGRSVPGLPRPVTQTVSSVHGWGTQRISVVAVSTVPEGGVAKPRRGVEYGIGQLARIVLDIALEQ
jgi:hypothetical protein